MTERPRIHFVIAANHAYVRGYCARQLLVDVGSRPVWGGITKAWATTPDRAADALAMAEERGWLVTVERTGERRAKRPSVVALPAVSEPEEEGLW